MKNNDRAWTIVAVALLGTLFCGTQSYSQQAAPATKPAANISADTGTGTAPASPAPAAKTPTLTDDERISLLEMQKRFLQTSLQMADLQGKYVQMNQQMLAVQRELQEAMEKVQSRIGKGWVVDRDTLAVSPAPTAAKDKK